MPQRRPKLSWEQRIAEARQQGLGWGEYLFRKGLLPIEGPLPMPADELELKSYVKQHEHNAFHIAILHGYVAAAAKAGLTTDGVQRRSIR